VSSSFSRHDPSSLPVLAVLPALQAALGAEQPVIVQAPPGAGKSTALPLALLQSGTVAGRIIMLEPRRLAARNIARFLADQLGEEVGQRVGYRVRGESRVSGATRLEIVTEGILTRMLQADPELAGVGLLIFDEFHERSLHADLALALSIESRAALRPDLKLLVMSATLEGLDFSSLLPDAVLLRSEGRAHPIDHHYRPINRQQPLVPQCGAVVLEALNSETGSLLVFLPGAGEIERLAQWLNERLGDSPEVLVAPLHGRLPFAEQQKAILPAAAGRRKIVLATNVAETSLTIEGIRVVVDSGLERRVRFDVGSGIERLELKQIAKASATQRAGRAGRLGPGICYRLWSAEQQERLDEQSPPDIRVVELSNLLLEAALWGCEPEGLPLLELPPAANLLAGRRLLYQLEALDAQHHLTARGRQMAQLPCHPRLAHLLLRAAELAGEGLDGLLDEACYLVALFEDDKRGADRLSALLARHGAALKPQAQRWRERLGQLLPALGRKTVGAASAGNWLGLLTALAWPDRIGKLRSGSRYQLSGGQSADLAPDHSLTGRDWLVAIDPSLNAQGIRLYLAEAVELAELQRYLPELFSRESWFGWDDREGRVRAEQQLRLGSIVLERQPLANLSEEQKASCLLEGIRSKGLACLPWDEESEQYLARLRCAAEWLPELMVDELGMPPVDEPSLLAGLERWLLPHLLGMSRLEQLKRLDLSTILRQSLSWPLPRELDALLPSHFTAPTGSRLRIRYQPGSAPVLPVRIQEMFGQRQTPTVARGKVALLVELLSPAQRPLQLTQDLAAFWLGSYNDVKKEMKGRYPRHYWPDDPSEAMPTRYTKHRMNKDNGSA
jgi:ATP-dependent helicase HrpB